MPAYLMARFTRPIFDKMVGGWKQGKAGYARGR